MTLDEVCATMRQRFTEAVALGKHEVTITEAEWNAMAEGVTLRDTLELVLDRPADAKVATDAAGVLAPHRRK